MGDVITIGVDLAKSVFQVHGVDAEGVVLVRRQLRRRQVLPFFEKLRPCLVGMEACATAHHWGREIERLGHRVRLMPPRYVKAYVKIQKNDAADAEAICEAVTRPTMRFVELKTCEQQSILVLHRTRQLFIRQRITLINAIRAHLAEFGVVAPIGRNGVEKLLQTIGDGQDARIPDVARTCLEVLAMQLQLVNRHILEADRRVLAWHRSNEASRRLDRIPGIGPLIATALVASVPNPQAFKSGAGSGRLDRSGPEAELEWRQGTARRHLQAWEPLLADVADHRSLVRDPICRDARNRASPLADTLAGASASQGRSRGVGQQDRTHGLGRHGAG